MAVLHRVLCVDRAKQARPLLLLALALLMWVWVCMSRHGCVAFMALNG